MAPQLVTELQDALQKRRVPLPDTEQSNPDDGNTTAFDTDTTVKPDVSKHSKSSQEQSSQEPPKAHKTTRFKAMPKEAVTTRSRTKSGMQSQEASQPAGMHTASLRTADLRDKPVRILKKGEELGESKIEVAPTGRPVVIWAEPGCITTVGSGEYYVNVNGSIVWALFDSGAALNIISLDVAIACGLTPLFRKTQQSIRTANNGIEPMLAQIPDLEIGIGPVKVKTFVFVARNLSNMFILGRPFKVVSRFESKNCEDGTLWVTVTSRDGTTSAMFKAGHPPLGFRGDQDSSVRHLHVRSFTAIPPQPEPKKSTSAVATLCGTGEYSMPSYNKITGISKKRQNLLQRLHEEHVATLSTPPPQVSTLYKTVDKKVKPVATQLPNGMKPGGKSFEKVKEEKPFVPGSRISPEMLDLMTEQQIGFLTECEIAEWKKLIMEYESVFAFSTEHLTTLNPDIEPPVVIPTVPHTPWQMPQMKFGENMKREAIKIINDELENGLLEPSQGAYRNQYFLVQKKDGRYRLILDLQPLNKVTIKDASTPPNPDEATQALAGGMCVSTGDGFSGYNAILVADESRDLLAFQSPFGSLVRKTRLGQGGTGSVATYQRIMSKVFAGLIGLVIVLFIDDFGIKGPASDYDNETDEEGVRLWVREHLETCRTVLERLRIANLTLSGKKCFFCVPSITMLAYEISREGRRPIKAKLGKIQDWKPCKNLTQARGFAGLAGFYRKFIKGFAQIMKPIYMLSQKEVKFDWGPDQQAAMAKIKLAMADTIILASPDYSATAKPMVITTDGGPEGWGAVLSQEQEGKRRTIEFESGFWSPVELNYPQVKKELLALCKAL